MMVAFHLNCTTPQQSLHLWDLFLASHAAIAAVSGCASDE